MSWTFYKLLLALFITLLISGACSKDSDEEFSGGGSTISSANFTVNSTIPEDNATNVSVSSSIVIGFNNEVNSTSVNANNFSLSTNGIAVSATISHTKTIVVLLPASSLSNGTLYSVSVSSTVKDTSDNSLSQDNTWKFTTVSASSDNSSDNSTSTDNDTATDTTPPSVLSISPADNSSSNAVNTVVIAVFSEPVSSATLSSSTFKLMDNASNSVSGSFSSSGSIVTFTPTDNLTHFRDYSISLTTGIQDSSGNALSLAKSSSFETLGGVVITSADSNGMVFLSGGRFQMGADNQSIADGDNESDETPTHTTKLTGPYYIKKHMNMQIG